MLGPEIGGIGMTVDVTCGSCGTRLPDSAKFCAECGTAIRLSANTAEYKQVTVLFADVVHSMDLAAVLHIERLREIITELLERAASVARRYGGGAVEYAGDGVMILFGAPVALEDHAFRACLAALAIQEEAARLAAEVISRDGVQLQLRVGLNSGQVIAGGVGADSPRYAATGATVGFAQRMESVAAPGAVVMSDSTAHLVEDLAVLDGPQWLRIKGADDPVRTHRLLGISRRDGPIWRTEATLVGRRSEIAALDAMADRAVAGRGGIVNVIGPPGIGKSRIAREAAAAATRRGIEVFWTFCESHAKDVPFQAVTRLLRARAGVLDSDDDNARRTVRRQIPDADPRDLLLLDDLLGIADPAVPQPQIDPETRRRRLTAVVNAATLARNEPAMFIIEDAHWMDAVSESLIADFLAVIPRTPSLVLITYRSEYNGVLARIPGVQTISLGPLDDSDTEVLTRELLGCHPSTAELAAIIAGRAAGNPFFAEEMVRELAQRGVLAGERGGYVCRLDTADISVPATVQAAIEARIDRLSAAAKTTLNTASVIGARFDACLLSELGIDAVFDELLDSDLIDQVRFAPSSEYAFHHPLIRAVAYESQLESVRAQVHRRLAAAIAERDPASADENAALIAEHLENAGELYAAYGWHMRAGAWSTNRDLVAARRSWRRALAMADTLPADHPDQLSMRIAPRTMLCATDLQAREVQGSQDRFAELRELCTAASDTVSLAIGMSGPATELLYGGRVREAAQLSSQQVALLASIDDPTPAMGLAATAFCSWLGVLHFDEIARWAQTVIDVAAGDPVKGAGYGVGSPLAIALAWRGTARSCLGRPDWRQDLHDSVALARCSNAETFSGAIAWSYGIAMQYGMIRVDEPVLRAAEQAVQTARRASSDRAVGLAAYTLAVGLLHQDAATDRHRGLELMTQARDMWLRRRILFLIPVTDLWAARESAGTGERDAAIAVMRQAIGELRRGYPFYAVWGTGVLAEALLARGADGDSAEAQHAIDWVASLAADHCSAMLDIALLRLRALQSRARGDDTYPDMVSRYCTMARSLGFEGHIAWAEALVENCL